jgi:hypothetical protein
MKKILVLLSCVLVSFGGKAYSQEIVDKLFICRSPLLANNFWDEIKSIAQKGIKITPEIAQQICDHMRAGDAPQCLRISGASLTPFASGWAGMLAITDGRTKVWFQEPDSFGWVNPEYYFMHMNHRKNQ